MTVYESFKNIPDFPGYMISSFGRVYNVRKNSWMTHSPTRMGDMTVGLNVDGWQYRRSVKVLVARAFVECPDPIFDTPIQLDGDRENLHATNIAWRPRWFAWKYVNQFTRELPQWAFSGPLTDVTTEREYQTMFDAAVDTGSLVIDIRLSLLNKKPVFPEGGIFAYTY